MGIIAKGLSKVIQGLVKIYIVYNLANVQEKVLTLEKDMSSGTCHLLPMKSYKFCQSNCPSYLFFGMA